jgi:hypothetical protein
MKKKIQIIMSAFLILGLTCGVGLSQTADAILPGNSTLVNYNSTNTGVASGGAQEARLSADGNVVAWKSNSSNVISGFSTPAEVLYKRNMKTGATSVESVDANGIPTYQVGIDQFSVSRTGRYIAFISSRNTVVNTHAIIDGARGHVYLRDTLLGVNKLVDQSASGALGNGTSFLTPYVSDDGRFITFRSSSTNLLTTTTPTGGGAYVKDMLTGKVTIVTASNTGTIASPSGLNNQLFSSCDGSLVVFRSNAITLTPQDDGQNNTYLVDLRNGYNIQNLTSQANADVTPISISCNGRYIVVWSSATNITSDSVDGLKYHAFRYDRLTGEFVLIDKTASGTVSAYDNTGGNVSDEGKIVDRSNDKNMVSPAANFAPQLYVHDPDAGINVLVPVNNAGVEQSITNVTGNGAGSYISAKGDKVLYNSYSNNLIPGYTGNELKLVISEID